ALSETWHTKDNDERIKQLRIEGFHPYSGQSGNNLKGGCGFFVANHLSYSTRNDLSKSYRDSDCEFEAFWIEIENKSKANSVFGVIYNHPRRNTSAFLDYLQSVFAKLNRENKVVFLCGDFNLNLLKTDISPNVDSFLNLLLSNFFQPLILKPTRFNDRSAPSLIDNIFINSLEPLTISGNLIDKISDHLPNFAFFGNQLSKNKINNSSMYRDYSNFNKEAYLQEAQKINFYQNENHNLDINFKYENFQNKFLELLNKHVPLKPKSKRLKRQQRKPWITKGILKSISTKNSLLKKFMKTKDDFWFQRYRLFRNTLNRVIKSSKQNYYSSYFNDFKKDSKKVWKGINELLNRNKAKSSQDIKLNLEGKLISDNKKNCKCI
ncbi:MAG: endonuclease/exonuclease/phosphatase family protein, partial [Flavobacteriaceae bacterium]|nr:endonuclease/exonuclease/phosphatase family protein [Flavobacteriaceae bacterium]